MNQREGWTGHLWQGRFSSFALDDVHLLAAARYIELNPVRAGLVERARDWPAFLCEELVAALLETLRRHELTGRPLGSEAFVTELEASLGRRLRPQKPGRKPNGAPERVNA